LQAAAKNERWPLSLSATAAFAGLVAAVVVAIGTAPPGPGLDPDAQSYVGAAVSLVHSGSYRVPTSRWVSVDTTSPLTHYPPGFSTLIAVPIAAGLASIESARLVIVLAAFVTWFCLVVVIARAAGTGAGVLGATAVLVTPDVVMQHLSILSEPPFLAALVITVGGMAEMAREQNESGAVDWRVTAVTGLAGAAAVMLRYAGLALVAGAVLWVVTGFGAPFTRRSARAAAGYEKPDWMARARLGGRAALIVAPTALALGAWVLRTRSLGNSNTVRTFGIYSGFGATALQGLRTITDWLIPVGHGSWRTGVAAVIATAALVIVVSVYARFRRAASVDAQPDDAAIRVSAALGALIYSAVTYIGFLVVSRLAADQYIPFDERLLSPFMLLAESAAAIVLVIWWRERRWPARVLAVGGVVIAAWLVASASGTARLIEEARLDGGDFAGIDWVDSPTLAWVRSPTGGLHRVLYTNWPVAVYFHADRASHDLPDNVDPLTLRRFHDRLSRSNGVVVGFTTPSRDYAPMDALSQLLGLRLIEHFEDGSVWELPLPPSESSRARLGG
jgi:hypothetical protein